MQSRKQMPRCVEIPMENHDRFRNVSRIGSKIFQTVPTRREKICQREAILMQSDLLKKQETEKSCKESVQDRSVKQWKGKKQENVSFRKRWHPKKIPGMKAPRKMKI
ncbi:MAG: hypothetical protein MR596_04775 [Lachnospiraceae bacterium]|nr:hypothetical protein [Lachnospiraceae bacterium]